ncbi:MAG TPA: hypothetical protein VFQ91_13125 [Bryobacteraceae bacterium]|nr:hypothetical protein [Bryobacteraceae bacterium]
MRPPYATFLAAAALAASSWAQPPAAEPDSPLPPATSGEEQPLDSAAPARAGGWRRVADTPPPPVDRTVPGQIVIPAGAWIKIRVDQPISSDRNRPGDGFAGTLAQPIVADGFVIAHRGQTIEGRVTEALKAGRAKGTSRLGLELTEIGLVDGQQMPVRTQLVEYNGGTSKGRDAAAIGATTGAGAAIGAAAGGGFGAGMGAIAGAVASSIGVLATRGRATEIYPETVVTFRTLAPITVTTERSAQAFQPVRQTDYERQTLDRRPAPQPSPSLYYGLYNPYFYGPGYWGPSFYNYWGPRYYYGGPRVFIGGRGGFRGRR